MNLRFLRTFVAIADNAGFARAAARLNLTQSAASRQIQALEDELGLKTFAVKRTREYRASSLQRPFPKDRFRRSPVHCA
jgi:DNA-binding transcriptional LysR family regulator